MTRKLSHHHVLHALRGLLLGHPLAFTLGVLALISASSGWGGSMDASWLLVNRAYGSWRNTLVARAALYLHGQLWTLGHRRAAVRDHAHRHGPAARGLGIAVIIACTHLRGTPASWRDRSVIGLLAIPATDAGQVQHLARRRVYLAAARWAILIPPSIMLVGHGGLTQISVAGYAAAFGRASCSRALTSPTSQHLLHQAEYGPPKPNPSTPVRKTAMSASPSSRDRLVFIVWQHRAAVATPTSRRHGCVGAIVLVLPTGASPGKCSKEPAGHHHHPLHDHDALF